MLISILSLALLCLTPQEDPAKPKEPPSREVLKAISERGRALAEYDRAAWHATDAVQKLNPREGSVRRYIAHKTKAGWSVVFGKLDDKQETFLVAYEAKPGKDPEDFQVEEYDPPKEDNGFYLAAARAIGLAEKDFIENFLTERRTYNAAVLPAEDGQVWVYLVPAPTKPGIFPVGGDARYLISKDGSRIIEKRQLHKAIIEVEPPKIEGQQQLAGMHTHILESIPEDTDVFHVLRRTPSVPEVIVTEEFVFVVDKDGTIKYIGKSEDVLPK